MRIYISASAIQRFFTEFEAICPEPRGIDPNVSVDRAVADHFRAFTCDAKLV